MNAVAELVLGLMLSLARQTARGDRAIRNEKWLKKELKGTELRGKYLGIIGTVIVFQTSCNSLFPFVFM